MTQRAVRPALLVAAGWAATRAIVLWLYLGRHAWVTGDVDYFAQSLAAASEVGLAQTLVEYPLPGVLVVALPWLLAELVGAPQAYGGLVLVLSMLADAAFTMLLAACAGPGRRAALTVWILAVPLLGATVYARFDLVPALLAATALLLLPARPRLAAACGAFATGLKLWPALVLPALAAPRWSRTAVVVVVALTGVLLAGASVALAGWSRLVSPLTWQAERGLQIESVAATPAMVGWALSPAGFEITYTEHHAFEITGAGTDLMLLVSVVLTVVAAAGLLVLWVAAWRAGRALGAETPAWLALAAVAAFMTTSKVLSPQYLLWLLPLAAAAVAVSPALALRRWAGVLLATTAATQLVFPELYGHLTGYGEHTGWAVLTLLVRNLTLVWLTLWACMRAVRGVSAAGRSPASHPGRTGRSTAACDGGPPTQR